MHASKGQVGAWNLAKGEIQEEAAGRGSQERGAKSLEPASLPPIAILTPCQNRRAVALRLAENASTHSCANMRASMLASAGDARAAHTWTRRHANGDMPTDNKGYRDPTR